MGFHRSIIVQKGERGLSTDAILRPQTDIGIDGVGELAHAKGVDELCDGAEFSPAGNPDDLNLGTVLLLDLCDRRGFAFTRRSPRRPEPQHDITTFESSPIELAPVRRRCNQSSGLCLDRLGGLGRSGRLGGLARSIRGRGGHIATGTTRRRDQADDEQR